MLKIKIGTAFSEKISENMGNSDMPRRIARFSFQLSKNVRGVGATDLIEWCRDKLAPYKVPQFIEFRDMLPKSKVGKLLRREVREEERRRQKAPPRKEPKVHHQRMMVSP